jgi:hypothetical protein
LIAAQQPPASGGKKVIVLDPAMAAWMPAPPASTG